MMTQSLALLLDAYRELHAKKMFWIVLILSGLVIGGFALLGVDGDQLTVLWYRPFHENQGGKLAYKMVFSYVVVGFWLTWIASLLAVISTAGIFPDFLSSGSIDLFLAKPIGRLRLFFTKYVAGLLFVTLQVTIFSALSFLVLGVRGGVWEPGLFWAIPLVVIFFSYLFSISVLLGVWTRSTVAALLLTLLAWFGIWAMDQVDKRINDYITWTNVANVELQDQVDELDAKIDAAKANPAENNEANISSLKTQRDQVEQMLSQREVSPEILTTEKIVFGFKTLVPKTRETINLLDRVLFQDKELQDASKHEEATTPEPPMPAGRRGGFRTERGRDRNMMELQQDRTRPVWWIVGTSLVFEAVMLALAAWMFCRRDY